MKTSQYIINREPNAITDEKRFLAARELNGTAYKLYTYLVALPEGENLYDRSVFWKTMGVSSDGARKAFEELIDKKYLIPINNLCYFFYEIRKN